MNIRTLAPSLLTFLRRYAHLVIYAVIVLVMAWLLYFTYQHLYTSVIQPKEIDPSEIIAKRQKVNLELFNEINQKIKQKKEFSHDSPRNVKNPFD